MADEFAEHLLISSVAPGRFEPDLNDLANSFSELGITLMELQNFWSETESGRSYQYRTFPATAESQLQIPEEIIEDRPEYIPDYLPTTVIKQEPKPEDKSALNTSSLANETSEKGPDPFDEAAAAPAPVAPNCPFINRSELPIPNVSSWGFKRVNISGESTGGGESGTSDVPSKPREKQKSSPDSYTITENSDDFVFTAKHKKAKEDKKHAERNKPTEKPIPNGPGSVAPRTPPPPAALSQNGPTTSSKLSTPPPVSASTPILMEKIKIRLGDVEKNGISKKLFEKSKQQSKHVVEEELSGFVPEKRKPKPPSTSKVSSVKPSTTSTEYEKKDNYKTPALVDSDSDDFANDFGLSESSSDELSTAKENMEKLLKRATDSPAAATEKPAPAANINRAGCGVPDYLPTTVIKQEPKPEDKSALNTSSLANETSEKGPDPFDEAAAAPAPVAPNCPFINRSELPIPNVSSWGFKRVNISGESTGGGESGTSDVPSKPREKQKSSPDSYTITENSDDFVFTAKHKKAKEDKKHAERNKPTEKPIPNGPGSVAPRTPPPPAALSQNGPTTSSKLSTPPPVSASTPILMEKIKIRLGDVEKNGISKKLFETSKQQSKHVVEEELSGFVPEKRKPKPPSTSKVSSVKPSTTSTEYEKKDNYKTPALVDSDSDDFANDFGLSESSSDELSTAKENMEKLLKRATDSPAAATEKPAPAAVASPGSRSPVNKRRRLDSPVASPKLPTDGVLLKYRPDLIADHNSPISKPSKPECKLTNNHNNHVVAKEKSSSNHHHHHNSSKKKGEYIVKIKKPKPPNSNHSENHHENSKPKKVKKVKDHPSKVTVKPVSKIPPKPIGLFDESPIKVPNHSSKPDKTPKVKTTTTTVNHVTAEPPRPKLAPITLSLPTKELKLSEGKKSKHRHATPPPPAVVSPMVIDQPPSKVASPKLPKSTAPPKPTLVAPPKPTLPTKPTVPAPPKPEQPSQPSLKISFKNPNSSKFKSKSTVDSDLDSLSSDSDDDSLAVFETLIPKKKPVKLKDMDDGKRTFKTKAELKNPNPVSSPQASSKHEHDTPPVVAKSGKSKPPKIKIGKNSSSSSRGSPKVPLAKLTLPKGPPTPTIESPVHPMVVDPPPPTPPPASESVSLKIPKIKIKIGGAHLNDLISPAQSPSPSYSSSTVTSPDPVVKPLKIRIPEPQQEPIKKTKKAKKVSKEVKEPRTKVNKVPKKPVAPVISPPPPVVYTPPPPAVIPPSLESTVVSETIVSETVIPAGEVIKIWYCPACQLPDDGSPMVGCDTCDEWYHWPCVGLVGAPEDEVDWFCPPCIRKKKSKGKKSGKRKRKT
eukprot:sb/3461047/